MSRVTVRNGSSRRVPAHIGCQCGRTAHLTYATSRRVSRTHKRSVTVAYECQCGERNCQLFVVDGRGRVVLALGSIPPREMI